jgi:ankyrin repeat protein
MDRRRQRIELHKFDRACQRGDIDECKRVIHANPDLLEPWILLLLLLHWAVNSDQLEICAWLIEVASFNMYTGGEALMHLLRDTQTSLKILDLLIAHGADIDQPWVSADTPLHVAVNHGRHPRLIARLIARGANVNAIAHCHVTPLFAAARGGYAKICQLLIANGADVGARAYVENHPELGAISPLSVAAFYGRANVHKAIIKDATDKVVAFVSCINDMMCFDLIELFVLEIAHPYIDK